MSKVRKIKKEKKGLVIMANREKILQDFSSKFRTRKKFNDGFGGVNKKHRKNYDAERRRKEEIWEDKEDER